MKKLLILVACTPVIIGVGLAGYHFLSPKAELANESGMSYDELVIELPTSRVSFGPIPPDSRQTIYFHRQQRGGVANYALYAGRRQVAEGQFEYRSEGELGRVLHFVIGTNGSVEIRVSG